MKTINIKDELEKWLVDYITDTVHKLETGDSKEFNNWAKAFKKEEAAFVVDMEFVNDWAYDKRTEITEKEAEQYALSLLKIILDNWYI